MNFSPKLRILTICFAFLGWLFANIPAGNTELTFMDKLVVTYGIACIPVGWSAISNMTSSIVLILPLSRLIMYIIIKGTISMVIGIFVLPFKLIGIIRSSL